MDIQDAMFLERAYTLKVWNSQIHTKKPEYTYEEIIKWADRLNAL